MVLHDVAHRARAVVVAGAFFDPDRFGGGDLNVIDVLTCPDRLEDAVREAEDEDVLDGLLAEVVIDPKDLVLAEHLLDDAGEVHRALEVVPIRLFHHDARPTGRPPQVVRADRADDRLVRGRRCREIEQPVAVRADLAIDAGEDARKLVESAVVRRRHVVDGACECCPDLLVDRPGAAELRDRVVKLRAERVFGDGAASGTDHGERRRQEML